MKKTNTNPDFMTVAEVKDFLNISQSSAYELMHRKDFPVFQVGGMIRVPRDAFMAWIELHTHMPSELRARLASA